MLCAYSKTKSPKLRKQMIKCGTDEYIKSLIEICFNVISGNYPVSPRLKSYLTKYKYMLRKVINPSVPLKTKRKTLVQSGGAFLPMLISTVLSGIFGRLFERKNE